MDSARTLAMVGVVVGALGLLTAVGALIVAAKRSGGGSGANGGGGNARTESAGPLSR